MSLGVDTIALNGSRFSVPTGAAYSPFGYGPQTTGVPQVSPSLPPYLGGSAAGAGSMSGAMEGVGGYGTAGNNATVAAIANANPWNFKASPLPWAILFIVVGLVLLKVVHWRETIEGSGGSFSADADAGEGAA